MIATALASHGKLDMLCNNAGVMDWGPSYELDAAETKLLGYRRNHIQAAVNEIVAQFRPSEITGKHDHSKKSERRAMMMKMLSGQTAFVTGGSGDIGVANKPAYTASKHDVIGLTHASTLQLGSTISPQPYCGSRRTIRHSSLAMILRSTEGWSRNSLASGVDSAPH
jgi:short-subunit dehydrogenase involved in D-alanine esterification of teichoic acids